MMPSRVSREKWFKMLTFYVYLRLLLRISQMMTPGLSTMWTLTTASPWKVISSNGPATPSRPGTGSFISFWLYSIRAKEELWLIECSILVFSWPPLVPARVSADPRDLSSQALVLHPEQSASLSEEI